MPLASERNRFLRRTLVVCAAVLLYLGLTLVVDVLARCGVGNLDQCTLGQILSWRAILTKLLLAGAAVGGFLVFQRIRRGL